MNRRHFLAAAAALGLAPAFAQAGDFVAYEPGVIETALQNGETVFVDYYTDWCSTCAAQARMIDKLRSENPSYDENITFVKVDWDEYGSHEVATSRNIPRRSTLIVLNGEDELGRVVAQSSQRKVQGLLDAGLAAATGS